MAFTLTIVIGVIVVALLIANIFMYRSYKSLKVLAEDMIGGRSHETSVEYEYKHEFTDSHLENSEDAGYTS